MVTRAPTDKLHLRLQLSRTAKDNTATCVAFAKHHFSFYAIELRINAVAARAFHAQAISDVISSPP